LLIFEMRFDYSKHPSGDVLIRWESDGREMEN